MHVIIFCIYKFSIFLLTWEGAQCVDYGFDGGDGDGSNGDGGG